MGVVPQLGMQKAFGLAGMGDAITLIERLGEVTARHFQHRLKLGVFGLAQAFMLAKPVLLGA